MTGDELVHDAAACAHKFVLSFLTQPGQLQKVDGETALMQEREADRNLDGCGRTKTCAEGHVTGDKEVCAAKMLPCRRERPGNAYRVVAPMALGCGGKTFQVGFNSFPEILGMDDQFLVAARGGSDPARKFNRGGKNEAVVVVSVLPDKVDAAGRAIDGGRSSEARAKVFLKLSRIYQRSYYFRFGLADGEEFAAAEVEKSATPMRITVSRVVTFSGFSVQMP